MSESQNRISVFLAACNQSNKTHSGLLLQLFVCRIEWTKLLPPNCRRKNDKEKREWAGAGKCCLHKFVVLLSNVDGKRQKVSFWMNPCQIEKWMGAMNKLSVCVYSHVWELGNWCFTIYIVHFGFDVYRSFHWNSTRMPLKRVSSQTDRFLSLRQAY